MKNRLNVLVLLLPLAAMGAIDYSVTVKQIEVWVKVTDKSGNPVAGLKQEDFEVYEDDVRMPAGCFEEATVSVPEMGGPQTAPELKSAPKKFVVFLDLLNTTEAEFGFVKPRIKQFLNQISNKGWEVMLVALLPSGKLGVVSPFTSDFDRIRSLLDEAKANSKRDLQMVRNVRELKDMLSQGGNYVHVAFSLARNYTKEEKENTIFSLDALASFANYLQKKNEAAHSVILFISGGFNSEPGRLYNNILEKAGVTTLASNAAVSSDPSSIPEPNFDLQMEIQKSIGSLNRFNITLYAINTRGMNAGGNDFFLEYSNQDPEMFRDYQNTLDTIASETGGVSFANSNNFNIGFDQVLTDLNHQYLLCYNAPAHKKAGEYHRIRVVCKRPDVELRYRQGYTD